MLELDGQAYLVTNEHVARGGHPLSARLLNGRKLTLTSVGLAENADLIRFGFAETDVPALTPGTELPDLGLPIAVFGNSDGGGVATGLRGRVVGAGPDQIEVDAGFVQGNSGSPIVDGEGRVLAIATYAVRRVEPDNWLKAGTRFNQVRRFGLRLEGVQWKSVKPAAYFARADALADAATFCRDLYDLRFTRAHVDPRTGLLQYDYRQNKSRYRRNVGMCRALADAVTTWNAAMVRAEETRAAMEAAHSPAAARSRRDAERNQFINATLTRRDAGAHVDAYERMIRDVIHLLSANDWLVPVLTDEAAYWRGIVEGLTGR